MGTITAIHAETRLIRVRFIDPDHAKRAESKEFRQTKTRLRADGHYGCYICGTTKKIQVHHRAAEYMFDNLVNYDLLKAFCEEWDIYGYGRLLRARPITSVDDIRNAMCLCEAHHIGVDKEDGGSAVGIHFLPFPEWIMQKLCLAGANPVPQRGETLEMAAARVKQFERKVLEAVGTVPPEPTPV